MVRTWGFLPAVLTGKHLLTYTGRMVATRNRPPNRPPDVFGAISHPARRQMLDLLAEADRSVNAIAGHFKMSRPAVSQHLRVLLDAGLVTEQRHGRERRYHLVPERLGPVRDWIAHYERFWDDRLQRLQKHAVQKEQRMTQTIRREILIPQPREQVWRAITDSATLAEWMFPNDFEPRVGHHFTFRVPANPKVNFDGLIVRCEVLECEPPSRLAFSWSAGGPVENTRVSFRLEPDGDGTRLLFEHSGFDVSQPFGEQAFKGAEFGWAKMLEQLAAVVARERRERR